MRWLKAHRTNQIKDNGHPGISDMFGVKGRVYIDAVLDRLPCDTAAMIRVQLTSLDQLEVQIEEIEERIAIALKPSPEVQLLRTLPGVGEILAPRSGRSALTDDGAEGIRPQTLKGFVL